MTNAKHDKSATPNMTNQPRNHPTKQEYVCKCGAKADVWDAFDTYCAVCYLQKQKALDKIKLI
tara:strand:- start:681 stop:869 length:189 start_codon:yes stop_codon:yes gene_type:complete